MLQTQQGEKSTREAASAGQSSRGRARLAADSRQLTGDDRGRVLDHLLRLSASDRQMRFCQCFTDANVTEYVANIDFQASACFGIFGEDSELIALVQSFAYDHDGVRMLEAAFSTDAPWRCRGLGTLLFHEVTDYAVAQRIHCVIAQCLGDNPSDAGWWSDIGHCDTRRRAGQWEVAGHACESTSTSSLVERALPTAISGQMLRLNDDAEVA